MSLAHHPRKLLENMLHKLQGVIQEQRNNRHGNSGNGMATTEEVKGSSG